MARSILAFVLGLVGWVLVASVLNRGLRLAFDGYAAAEPHLAFTLGMLAARLTLGALASVAAGAVAGLVDRPETHVAWILGGVIVVAFVPVHVQLWTAFPVWYHLTFLLSLLPCVLIGWRFVQTANRSGPPASAPS
jgi:hypothetical protein